MITADQVKSLREETGAGMMDCKKALADSGGDVEKAKRALRERGVASAGKRAGRTTKEGIVLTSADGSRVAMVAVGCETEPVARNAEFLSFARRVLDVTVSEGPGALGKVEEDRIHLAARIGENIAVKGADRFDSGAGRAIRAYVHRPANKLGVLVEVAMDPAADSQSPQVLELLDELAMQIAATNPACIRREDVPAERIAEERAILEKQVDPNKPPPIRVKIVDGKLNAFYEQMCLMDQIYIRDTKKKIKDLLTEKASATREPIRILRFVRFALGE